MTEAQVTMAKAGLFCLAIAVALAVVSLLSWRYPGGQAALLLAALVCIAASFVAFIGLVVAS